jgi:hypothetical protein
MALVIRQSTDRSRQTTGNSTCDGKDREPGPGVSAGGAAAGQRRRDPMLRYPRHLSGVSLGVGLVTLLALLPCGAGATPPVGFATHVDYATGENGYVPAAADLNGDGHADILVPNAADNTVSILLGYGDGTFAAGTDVAVGSGPISVAIGDLNSNGKPDMVSEISGAASVLLGNGDGTFGPPTTFPVGGGGSGRVMLADLNGDGRLDVAAGSNGNVVSVLLGRGDGTFDPPMEFTTGWSPRWIELGDLNRDGKLDVVATNRWENTITVLIGNGDGTFGSRVDYAGGPWPFSIAIGDFNGDGNPDVVVSEHWPFSAVSLYLGNGDGTLGPKTDFELDTGGVDGLAGRDFNLDGLLDVAVVHSGGVAVLLGDGAGGFAPKQDFATAEGGTYLAAGDLNGDDRLDIVAATNSRVVSVLLNTSGTTIAAQPPVTCITPTYPCVQAPVTISNRPDAVPVRGYSVDVQLSGNLTLCSPEVTEGPYLSDIGTTHFEVVANGGGSYTVDCVILGLPCGATAPSGTLFTLHLASAESAGTGTVSVTGATLRNCDNAPVSAYAGDPASIPIDNTPPLAVSDLTASQVKTGNDADGTTAITISFTAPADGVAREIYRAPYGTMSDNAYPEYDDMSGAGEPALPSYPPGAPWTMTGVSNSGDVDEVASRGYWYYVIFTKDECDNVSGGSNLAGGTLNYHLGDVSDGVTSCAGDNAVLTADISLLGGHYGASIGYGDPASCLDVGPTTDYSVDGLPTTDNNIDFEDLMMFAINFGQVSLAGTMPAAELAVSDRVEEHPLLALVRDPAQQPGSLTARLFLRQNTAAVKGIHAVVTYDQSKGELLDVSQGSLLLGGNIFFRQLTQGSDLVVDAAIMGQGETITGSGEVAVLRFKVKGAGLSPALTRSDLRGRDNQFLGQEPENVVPMLPQVQRPAHLAAASPQLALVYARPNPFGGTTALQCHLLAETSVRLQIFDVTGRLVRSLEDRTMSPGEHSVIWDGRDDRGQHTGAGIYLCTFQVGDSRGSFRLYRYR